VVHAERFHFLKEVFIELPAFGGLAA